MKSSLFAIFAMLVLLTPAWAAAWDEPTTVKLDVLDAAKVEGRLEVSYVIEPRSWRELRRAGISPRLNLWTQRRARADQSYAYSVQVDRRSGTVVFPRRVRLRGVKRLAFEWVGYSREHRIGGVEYRGRRTNRVELQVHGDHAHEAGRCPDARERRHEPRRRRESRADLEPTQHRCEGRHEHGATCSDHGAWATGKSKQRSSVRADVVEACRDAVFSSQVPQCVRGAGRVRVSWQVGLVAACGAAFVSNTDVLACVASAGPARWAPAEVVRACDEAFVSSRATLRCVEEGVELRSNAATLVRACGEAVIGESDTLRCITAGRS